MENSKPNLSPEERKENYRWGFYYNREDPRIWIPKLYGLGWTLNFAKRGAYVFAAALVALIVLAIIYRKK
jgi:uncharacterized membrane protein